jgi:hypothetical protein
MALFSQSPVEYTYLDAIGAVPELETCLALTLERLYRQRYLHRGLHPVRTAIDLFRLLLLGLSIPVTTDSS